MSVIQVFGVGMLATSSLVLGSILALKLNLSNKWLGVIMAFGAGTLISAVSLELTVESLKKAQETGYAAYGFFTGALVFFISDYFIGKLGTVKRKSLSANHQNNLVVPMVLAIILDGIPESIVIGIGMSQGQGLSMAMFAAVFISNLPEAIAGTVGMKTGGWATIKIVGLWVLIALVCGLFTLLGFTAFNAVSQKWLAFVEAFAAGAILLMLANTMIPEAFEHGKKISGLFTVLGFAISVAMLVFERHSN